MPSNAPIDLNARVLGDGALERVPFFNGRVLTAEDLQAEQDANAAERRRLGRALGPGVLKGLFVRSGSTDETVTVEPGLGLAPSGRMVHLPREVEVSVVSNIEREATTGTKGKFEDCAVQSGTITTGAGAYVLFGEPASKTEGRTPRTTISGDGAAGECGAERRVEGARLRLVHLDTGDEDVVPTSLAEGDGDDTINGLAGTIVAAREQDETPAPNHVSKLRNLLAHVCLRTPSALTDTASLYDTLRRQARGETSDPVGADGPLDVLRRRARQRDRVDDLDDAVPLGLFYWSSDRIEFVDSWSVRRRIHRPDPQQPAPATARRRVETEASIFQFQRQMAEIADQVGRGGVVDVRMTDYFRYLPPVCLIPRVNSAGTPGVLPDTFLRGYPARSPVYTEGRRATRLMEQALGAAPIDLRQRTGLRTYYLRENDAGRNVPETVPGPLPEAPIPSLLLADGSLPFIGDPRFDLAHVHHAHFAAPRDL